MNINVSNVKVIGICFYFLFMISCSSSKKEIKKIENTTNLTASLAYQTKAQLGEGAFWNYKNKELLWIDIEGKKINRFNPKTNQNIEIKTKSRPGTIVPITNTEAAVALEDGIHLIDLDSGSDEVFVNMKVSLQDSRLNDGKCDPSGRLWVGSMHFDQLKNKANLFCVTSDKTFQKKKDSVTISNGIVWTADKKTMYYIDTPTATIKAYDFDNNSGNISNERVVVNVNESFGFPDGMAIDKEDMLWVAMWNGNAVIRFNPNTGKVIQKIEVPAHNITSCAFGGDNFDELYITSATVDMTAEELIKYPLSGSIFKVKPGVQGVKSTFFKKN